MKINRWAYNRCAGWYCVIFFIWIVSKLERDDNNNNFISTNTFKIKKINPVLVKLHLTIKTGSDPVFIIHTNR